MILCSLDLLIQKRGDDDVVAWRHGSAVSFGQFRQDVQRMVSACVAYSSAALVCKDSYLFLVGLYGLLHAGAKIVLPPGDQPELLGSLRDTYDVVLDDLAVEAALRSEACTALMAFDPELPLIDFFTSGSTGKPKCVSKSLAMFDREIQVAEKNWGGDVPCGRVFATVPHHHVYGFTFKLLWAVATGRAFVAETHAMWETLLADLTDGSVLVTSPAHLGRLQGLDPLPAERRPRLILSAGAPLSLEASEEALRVLGCRPREIFGSTETGAVATRSLKTGDEPWQLLDGVKIDVEAEGRLSVQSSFIGPEWIQLSDVVEPVAGGFYHKGRADRIVKIEGKRVALLNVEEVLTKHPYVKAVSVVFLQKKQKLAAAIVLSKEGLDFLTVGGSFRLGRVLRMQLGVSLDAAAIPRLWRFVDAFPQQSMGKKRASDIAMLFGEDK